MIKKYRLTKGTIQKMNLKDTEPLRLGDVISISGDSHIRGSFKNTNGDIIRLVNGVVCSIKRKNGPMISSFAKDNRTGPFNKNRTI